MKGLERACGYFGGRRFTAHARERALLSELGEAAITVVLPQRRRARRRSCLRGCRAAALYRAAPEQRARGRHRAPLARRPNAGAHGDEVPRSFYMMCGGAAFERFAAGTGLPGRVYPGRSMGKVQQTPK